MLTRLIQTKVYYKLFYSISKETSQEPLRVVGAKKSFLSVFIIDVTCFKECFLLHVITGNNVFIQIYCYPEAWCNRHVAAVFEISVLKEDFILCLLPPQ